MSNTIKDLMAYFNVPTKGIAEGEIDGNTIVPSDGTVTTPEFSAFWKSLSPEDKEYYKTAQI